MKPIRRALGMGITLLGRLLPPSPTRPLPGLVLYHFSACPFCLRVRLAMRRLGISLPCRDVDASAGHRQALETGGGRVQVPCLHIIDGEGERWLYESADIIAYLTGCSRRCTHE